MQSTQLSAGVRKHWVHIIYWFHSGDYYCHYYYFPFNRRILLITQVMFFSGHWCLEKKDLDFIHQSFLTMYDILLRIEATDQWLKVRVPCRPHPYPTYSANMHKAGAAARSGRYIPRYIQELLLFLLPLGLYCTQMPTQWRLHCNKRQESVSFYV